MAILFDIILAIIVISLGSWVVLIFFLPLLENRITPSLPFELSGNTVTIGEVAIREVTAEQSAVTPSSPEGVRSLDRLDIESRTMAMGRQPIKPTDA